tara:strand:+ start:31 stop:1671 length:1641 start_codon:yes stop_codon:yes gene_type:complete
MKKIKTKITNDYNRYISLISKKTLSFFNRFSKNIKSKINIYNRYISSISKKTLLFVIRLRFMRSSKFKISVFNRYLILLIIVLFSNLFYLSIPTFYNYGQFQKDLTKKISEEFNLNTALSANINYRILPSPNFEISNVLLNTSDNEKFNDYAHIKKMKVFVKFASLYNQNSLEIKNIIISEANFNINRNSYNYLNNYLKDKISNKKIKIKKSKIFFKDSSSEKDVLTISTIKKSSLFYDKKSNNNKIIIEGLIYNTKYNLTLLRNTNNKNITDILIKLKKLNAIIQNEFIEDKKNKNNYSGIASINFSGSEIKANYKKKDNLIKFNSEKSQLNNHTLDFNGIIIQSPFFYKIDVYIETINAVKLIDALSKVKNLLDEKILLNENLNGKIIFNINSLKGIKFFDEAKIKLEIINGKLILSNSILESKKIGKILFVDSILDTEDNKTILKSKVLFNIYDQKKFYQKLLISKNDRIKLNNIYFEVEKDLNISEVEIKKIILNKKIKGNSLGKTIDLSSMIDLNELNQLKNWIELKKFSSEIFSKVSKLN